MTGIQAATLNRELFGLQGFMRFWAKEGQPICGRMLELKPLKAERRLPRDVAVDHLQALWREISRAAMSPYANVRRIGLMDRAWFPLMLHSRLRTIEVRRLTLNQVDLAIIGSSPMGWSYQMRLPGRLRRTDRPLQR